MKFIKYFFISILFSIFIQSNISFASFSDVLSTHQNYQAITFLQENNIINGYPDGTFHPESAVNRAEFLKIIIGGSSIPLDANSTENFFDVRDSDWFAPYVKKAKQEGWVQGYTDGSFKPTQTISKSEALKILGEVQNWTLNNSIETKPFNDVNIDDWFAPYVQYAKTNNFINNSLLFFPVKQMNRAEISEIIYQTLKNNDTFIPPAPIADPVIAFSTIDKSYFNSITLSTDLPNTFYKNEVYVLSGNNNIVNQSTTVILQNLNTKKTQTFTSSVNGTNFEIPIFFTESGKYNIGIISGETGQSKAAEIAVLNNIPSSNSPTNIKSNQFSIYFKNNQTVAQFDQSINQLKKLTFEQNENKVSYYNRQNLNKFPIQYKDFKFFKEQTVDVTLELAEISSQAPLIVTSTFNPSTTKSIIASEHSYSYIDPNITFSPPETQTSLTTLSISGKTKVQTPQRAYIIKPDGFVDEILLTTNSALSTINTNPVLPANANFTFQYTPKTYGRYIIEINNLEGIALINHPIYIDRSVPLIPDFFDLNEREFFGTTFTLSQLQSELLNEINKSRSKYGLPPVTLSAELNNLSQQHSDDMAENNFFSHINLGGMTPDARRLGAGIKTPVGENIAKDTSILFAHFGLMRSAAHRSNILNPDWERVGIGISLKDNYLIITEEFSSTELTNQDISTKVTSVFNEINSTRINSSLPALLYNANITSAAEELNTSSIQNSGLDITTFNNILKKYDIYGSSQAIGRIHSSWTEISKSITSDALINDPKWKYIGINAQIDSNGNINVLILLNQP